MAGSNILTILKFLVAITLVISHLLFFHNWRYIMLKSNELKTLRTLQRKHAVQNKVRKVKQVGAVIFGAGLNAKQWVAEQNAAGLHVRVFKSHAESYSVV